MRNKLSGFIDKGVDRTMTMEFMPLSDVVMFGAHVLPFLLYHGPLLDQTVKQLLPRLDLPVIQLWVQIHPTGVITFYTSLVHT